jgi:hypothetical protein
MEEDDLRKKARYMIGSAISSFQIPRAEFCTCAHCGRNKYNTPHLHMHYHHEDYTKPLEVIPLCVSCHAKVHAKERRPRISRPF